MPLTVATCSAPAGIGSSIITYCARGPFKCSRTTIISPERSSPDKGSIRQLALLLADHDGLRVRGFVRANVLTRDFFAVQVNLVRIVRRKFLADFQIIR